MDPSLSYWEAAARLALALVCGAVVGWDRESRGREAGLRTHIMVALGAAGFTLIAVRLARALAESESTFPGDPIRIIAAIVGGVGFLGAGAIIQSGGRVRGLTTAAGLWVIASVGVSAGLGLYFEALVITGLAFITLRVLGRFERRVPDSD